jgi:hypothetical protein
MRMLPVLPGTSTEMRGTCDERLQLRIPRAHAPQGNLLSGWLVPMFTPPVVMATASGRALTLELHHSLLHEWISVGRPCVLWESLFPVNTLSVLPSVSEYLCATRNPDEGYYRARETL